MTDRKLLELAAKAAGVNIGFFNEYDKKFGFLLPNGTWWNPFTDGSDALLLAACLEFSVFTNRERGTSWACNKKGDNIAEVLHDDAVGFDPGAATRRAIVLAAAEIGKKE